MPFHHLPPAGLTTAMLLLASTTFGGAKDGSLDLYWIDSEGGGSTLIVTPAGESVLIDAGNPGVRDPGRIHHVATEVAGLSRIDHLIVTHFHIDHFGGAAELAARLPVSNLWDNGLPDTDPDGRRNSTWPLTSRPYRELPAGRRHAVKPGTVVPLRARDGSPPVELRCIIARREPWIPPTGVRTPAPGASEPVRRGDDPSDNANSSAWILAFGGFRFYDGGDLTWNTEATLVWPRVLVPEVDVVQVTHHGLDVSNHPRLLQALHPTVSVMNNGPTKGAMAEVLQSLRALPGLSAQYQVHRNLRADGSTNNCPDAFIANPGSTCAGDFIHCAVAPDATSYTISIPARQHRARYEVRARKVHVRP